MIEIACTCDEGCGAAHTHVRSQARVRLRNGTITTMPEDIARLNIGVACKTSTAEILEIIPEHIRMWVPWKQVARELMHSGGS